MTAQVVNFHFCALFLLIEILVEEQNTIHSTVRRMMVHLKAGNKPKWSRHKRLDLIAPMNLNAIGNQVNLLMNNGVKM